MFSALWKCTLLHCAPGPLTLPAHACVHAGIIIPPLPEKNVVQKYQMTTEFIEARRRALTVFINRVVRCLFWHG